MDNTVLVSGQGLTRDYGRHRALHDVDLELKRGEILGFLGPNGAGKSTTMQILSGVLAPHAGSVEICGIDLAKRPVDAKRRLGYLPEIPPLYREAQVDEYLSFCARLRGVPAGRVEQAVADVKMQCGLHDTGARLIGNLSKGYQQRVGLAQAIVHKPEVLILDEPTVGLDPNQIRDVRALIRELGRRHAVILSTHILSEVQAVCSRVCILDRGRIVFDQPVKPVNEALQLSLREPPERQALECVPGVISCEAVGPNTFQLAVSDPGATAERLAEAAARSGWGLRELKAADPALEQIFVRLTCGDAVAGVDTPP
jgi:ABC-2 type transport system ATP-binding protein